MHKRVHTNAQHTDAVAAILTSRNPNFDNSSGLALWGISTGKLGSHSLDTRRCDGRIGGRHFHVILNTRPVSDSLLKTCFELAIFVFPARSLNNPLLGDHSCTTWNRSWNLRYNSWSLSQYTQKQLQLLSGLPVITTGVVFGYISQNWLSLQLS